MAAHRKPETTMGEAMKRRRLMRGYSIPELARRAGVNRSYLWKVEVATGGRGIPCCTPSAARSTAG